MIELYHEWNSVHSFKVRVVLAEKSLSWTDRRIELLKYEHLRPEYLKLNPAGVVPTLVHDGKVITESSVICQYLDEVFTAPSLLPGDALGRAKARTWLKIFDDVAHPAIRKASFELLYKPLIKIRDLPPHPDPERARAFREPPNPAAVGEAITVFESLIARMEASLGTEWLAGDAFSLADAAMAPFVERLEHLELDLLKGRAKAWAQRVLARPSVIAAKAPAAFRFPGPR
jgi:glutathione S-transferase